MQKKTHGHPGHLTAPRGTLKILQVEPPGCRNTVVAQFNPKEVQHDTSVAYQAQGKSKSADLEFTSRDPQTMSFELLFDGYEGQVDVMEHIQLLLDLTRPQPIEGSRRPPKVRVIWGVDRESASMPTFDAVVEKVSVKYTMFSPDGIVQRATASVSFKEAGHHKVGRKPAR